MKNKLHSYLLTIICCGLCVGSSVAADEVQEIPHAVAGCRAETSEAKNARLSTRDSKIKACKDKSKKKGKVLKNAQIARSPRATNIFYSQHSAVYQNPIAISFSGDSIELTDGSIWLVNPTDSWKVINWFATDSVVITPNHTLFSAYEYRITNQTTFESIAVNLHLGPVDPAFGGLYTHWIVAIDYPRNIVYLEDGSVWFMSMFDRNVINQWVLNDVVIIGINDGWLPTFNPNMLINVNMLNYAAGASTY